MNDFETITRGVAAESAPQRVHIAADPGAALRPARTPRQATTPVFEVKDANIWYGAKHALADVTTNMNRNLATALIGPSGCGKSTFLR
ncbi:MAG: hypothetical protein ACRDKI_12630, partial [Solirubrobacterales bacterium]